MQRASFKDFGRFLPGIIAAGVLLAAVTAVAFIRTDEAARTDNAVDGIYRRALYETCKFTEGMAVNLNKLTVAGNSRCNVLYYFKDFIRFLPGMIAAGVLLAAVTAVAFIRTGEAARTDNAVDGIYRRAFYETCAFTEGMAVNPNKLTVAGGSRHFAI